MATANVVRVYGVLPPLCVSEIEQGQPNHSHSHIQVSGPYKGKRGFTVFNHLLPHIEQSALYDASKGYIHTRVNGRRVSSTVIAAYLCPSEPSPSASNGLGATRHGGAHTWAIGNYTGNYFIFGAPERRSTEGANRTVMLRDGLSNVIFFTERYGTCGTSGNPDARTTYGNLWSDSNSVWRPAFCINVYSQIPREPGYEPCLKFQVTPDWVSGCESRRAQSPHMGGINVALGDGSVHFLAETIEEQVWQHACDPRDGNPLGAGWY
jgi:hypothetical protein